MTEVKRELRKIMQKTWNWKGFVLCKPDPLKVGLSEKYIEALLEDWLSVIEQSRANNEIDKEMLFHFGMSNNQELKDKRKATYPEKIHDLDNELFEKLESNKKQCLVIGDTHDNAYQICFQKWDYIVVALSKPTPAKREKPARGYHITCTKSEAPLFHERCTRQPKATVEQN